MTSAKKKTPSPHTPSAAAAPPPAAAQPSPVAITSRAVVPAAVSRASLSYVGVAIKPVPYDPAIAKAALATLRPRMMAIPQTDLRVPRLDVRAAALAALGLHAFVTQVTALHARYAKLADIGEFDLRNVADLRALGVVVLYLFAQAEADGAFKTDAKVPASLIAEGTAVEKRMQSLTEYEFAADKDINPLLVVLSPGSSRRDLANDLNGYADIYEMRPDDVASDTTNYRPTDVTDARRIAGEILSHLAVAMSPQAREAYEALLRAWTLLVDVHLEVREVGLTLHRHDPKAAEWFPSLFAAGRPGRSKKKVAADPGGAVGHDGGPESPPNLPVGVPADAKPKGG